MNDYIDAFVRRVSLALDNLPKNEIARALNILQAVYERDGRIYVFGNGGSLALATHWVADLNKTVFAGNLSHDARRFAAIRVPSTEEEITAWANDVSYDMIFAGPLANYLRSGDVVIAISVSGNSRNVINAVELAKERNVPVIGLTGSDGGELKKLSDAKIHVASGEGDYEVVESLHAAILHLTVQYFKDLFSETNKATA
jgi:D-sedoheptulose 7-phosphate isomerase